MSIAQEFKAFLLRGNLIDLAVAVVIGLAFTALINSLVADLLTPIIAAIFGEPDFSGLTFEINDSTFRYGSFINALITFVLVAAALFFFVVKPYNMYQARRRAGQEPEEPATKSDELVVLEQIRDSLRTGPR
jgi:large conductance mechanosensitive channel